MGITSLPPSFGEPGERFLRVLRGRNRSPHTLTAYGGDLRQFCAWLLEHDPAVDAPAGVTRIHLNDYLAHLAAQQLSGASRARKLAAIREFFKHLEDEGVIGSAPVRGVQTPKKERKEPEALTRAEYSRLLALAGANSRDYALFAVLLQTGIRVSELCDLRLADVDVAERTLRVRGKGMVERTVELERKGALALRRWLAERPGVAYDHHFLYRYDEPLGPRGVKKLVQTYRTKAGITKKVGAHGLSRTATRVIAPIVVATSTAARPTRELRAHHPESWFCLRSATLVSVCGPGR